MEAGYGVFYSEVLEDVPLADVVLMMTETGAATGFPSQAMLLNLHRLYDGYVLLRGWIQTQAIQGNQIVPLDGVNLIWIPDLEAYQATGQQVSWQITEPVSLFFRVTDAFDRPFTAQEGDLSRVYMLGRYLRAH
jgi:hypothetical protein